jgi:hypothetical protein
MKFAVRIEKNYERVAGILAKIRTGHIRNISHKRYTVGQLAGSDVCSTQTDLLRLAECGSIQLRYVHKCTNKHPSNTTLEY